MGLESYDGGGQYRRVMGWRRKGRKGPSLLGYRLSRPAIRSAGPFVVRTADQKLRLCLDPMLFFPA